MKRVMSLVLLTAVAVTATSGAAFAQNASPDSQLSAGIYQTMRSPAGLVYSATVQAKLGLSAAQKHSLQTIRHAASRYDLVKNGINTSDPKALEAGIKKYLAAFRASSYGVLSLDQKEELFRIYLQKHHYAALNDVDVQAEFGVTDEQADEIAAANRLYLQAEDMIEDSKQPSGQKASAEAQAQQDFDARVEKTLTSEQEVKYRSMLGA